MIPTPLSTNAQLSRLAEYYAGEFDNRQQSLADPAWFLHLRVWNRPLPAHIFATGYGFFIEQVNVATGQPPYRQRILHFTAQNGILRGQYFGLNDPQAYAGSSRQPERLTQLQSEDLVDLPTCCLNISYNPGTGQFEGRLPANTLCSLTMNGNTSYINLGFDIGPDLPSSAGSAVESSVQLAVYDHGVDSATGKTTWGPRMGPFQLLKTQSFGI